jgi:guanylate cyclase soluble subunit beta
MVDGRLKITDFPLHDAARDLLFLSESHVAQTRLMVRLDELSCELVEEQERSEELLFSMLPRSVVEDLKDGRRVRGQQYEAVTILFSDIVGFTDLSSKCEPSQICHVRSSSSSRRRRRRRSSSSSSSSYI